MDNSNRSVLGMPANKRIFNSISNNYVISHLDMAIQYRESLQMVYNKFMLRKLYFKITKLVKFVCHNYIF